MREMILAALQSSKGRGGYFGLTPQAIWEGLRDQDGFWDVVLDLESERLVYVTRSSQAIDRGQITLVTFRPVESTQ